MKETKRQNILGLPYSLHDARVSRIEVASERITLWFDKGYYKPAEDDCLPVKGHITLEGVDFDFCSVYLMDYVNDGETFSGEKFSLQQFAAVCSTLSQNGF